MLTGAIFAGLSALRGPHWLLQETEKKSIGTALADCLNALPESQAEKSAEVMSKFAAPIALVGALTAAVMPRVMYEQQHMAAQLKAEAARKAAPKAATAPTAPTQTQVNPNVSSVPTPTANPQTSRLAEADSQLYRSPADARAVAPAIPSQ